MEIIEHFYRIRESSVNELIAKYSMGRDCEICYNPFISLSTDEYYKTVEKIKFQYDENVSLRFEIKMPIERCFDRRFVCLTCKNNNFCYDCLSEITKRKNLDYKKIIIAKCPFCRTDKVIIPIEVLDNIKLHSG
jgi:hypothetical protein